MLNPRKNIQIGLFLVFICLAGVLFLSACNYPGLPGEDLVPVDEIGTPLVPDNPGEPGDSVGSGIVASAGDDPAQGGTSGEDAGGTGSEGPLKPVGFVNYGDFDATVRPYVYYPLGNTEPVMSSNASTVSAANDGVGDWPNTSRFLSLPMGAYSWCIDWTPGDVDQDGDFDYFHYIQDDPTILDENDSDVIESAEEVAISAPPSAGRIEDGKCAPAPVRTACTGSRTVQVYTNPGWVISSDLRPEVIAHANQGDFPPPAGITITSGGGYALQKAWVLYEAGHFLEATTSDLYSAIGVQPHGESIIGWARVLFDGVEVWRGDTSSYWHDADAYLHAVYIEVSCFPPGTHTLRIEALGVEGSGGALGSGGRIDVPIAYFGFRE